MTVRLALSALWRTILTPSPVREDGYTWAIVALGHVALGAALAGALGGLCGALALGVRVAMTFSYWLIKEQGDLGRGGTLRDGLIDTAWVSYGLFYVGPWWWPVLALLGAALGGLLRELSLGGHDA